MDGKLNGIDVSHWNDLKKIEDVMRTQDVSFCFAKASEGKGMKDEKFQDFMGLCDKHGIIKGAYHFARPALGNKPEDEAENFLKQVNDDLGSILLALDWEGDALKCSEDWALSWLDYVKNKTGVSPLFYCQEDAVKKYSKIAAGDYGLWVARHNEASKSPTVEPWKFWAFWQFSSREFDKNFFNGDFNQLVKYLGAKKVDVAEAVGCDCKCCEKK